MKNFNKVLLSALFGLLLIATSCGTEKTREDKAAAIITKIDSPFFIMNMTPQNLMDKSGVMDGVLPFTYELILEFFIDESVTGIDYGVKSQVVIGKGESFTPNFYGIFKVKDQKLFKDLLDKEANAELGEKDGFNYAIKESEAYCVVWNEEFAIISNIEMDFAAMLTGGGGDQGMSMVDNNINLIKAAEDGEAEAKFVEFLKKDADMSWYYDGEGMYGYMESMAMMQEDDAFKQNKDMYEGVSVEMYLNFNNGSIDLEFVSHLTDQLKEDFGFIADGAVDSKLLSYGASPNPVMVGSYNVQFKDFITYMEEQMQEGQMDDVNEGLEQVGLTMDEAKGVFTGEMVYVIDRLERKTKTMDFGYGDPYTYTTTEPLFAFAAGLKDKSTLEKALKSLMSGDKEVEDQELTADMGMDEMMAALEQMEGYGKGPEIKVLAENVYQMDKDAFMYLGNDVVFVSNDSAWALKVAAGSGVKIKDPKGDLGKFPMAIYGNFASLAKMEDLKDARDFVNLFVEFHGGANLDGGSFHLILKDSDKNSLRVITEAVADQLNKLEQMSNPDLYEELESATEESAESCEGGACEAGACEAGACEGGK